MELSDEDMTHEAVKRLCETLEMVQGNLKFAIDELEEALVRSINELPGDGCICETSRGYLYYMIPRLRESFARLNCFIKAAEGWRDYGISPCYSIQTPERGEA